MTLDPQNATTNKENAASEEKQLKTKTQNTTARTEAEEKAKKRGKAQETARMQQDTQPEVENQPQGLNETQNPAEPGAEDAVRERRIADEFVLNCSDEALAHMASTSTDDMLLLIAKAYVRIYRAEAVLCGAIEVIAPLGRVPPLKPNEKWWTPFDLDGRWFKLRYHQKFIREYEIVPSDGPTPGDDHEPPPEQRRQQRRPPPARVGPRARRNRNDAQGVRAAAAKLPQRKRTKKRRNDAKRIVNELYNLVSVEIDLRLGEMSHMFQQQCDHTLQRWREIRTQLLRSFDDMKGACGTVIPTWRDALASIVQVRLITDALARSLRECLSIERQPAPETFGPIARLEPCDAGHGAFPRLRINSWKRDEPQTPWAEYIFGVDWTLNIFGVLQEEQAYT